MKKSARKVGIRRRLGVVIFLVIAVLLLILIFGLTFKKIYLSPMTSALVVYPCTDNSNSYPGAYTINPLNSFGGSAIFQESDLPSICRPADSNAEDILDPDYNYLAGSCTSWLPPMTKIYKTGDGLIPPLVNYKIGSKKLSILNSGVRVQTLSSTDPYFNSDSGGKAYVLEFRCCRGPSMMCGDIIWKGVMTKGYGEDGAAIDPQGEYTRYTYPYPYDGGTATSIPKIRIGAPPVPVGIQEDAVLVS